MLQPKTFFEDIIELIETEAYYFPRIENWQQLKAQFMIQVNQTDTIVDTYPIIRDLLNILGDKHSHLVTPQRRKVDYAPQSKPLIPTGKLIKTVGYIKLPKAVGDDNSMQQYAETGHQLIRNMIDATGWIIDLRDNTGGNMWAMLTAIGAVIGEGTLGYFVNRDHVKTAWGYKEGASIYDGDSVYEISNSVKAIGENKRLAVLINQKTGSSGEITLISSLGRANMRTFGQITRGKPTANSTFPLVDGSLLALTTAITADRHGNTYEQAIYPNVTCTEALSHALDWITS